MFIQEFAYQLAQKIQIEHTIKISRSHIYELIAVDQGYKSYNAFVSQNLLIGCGYDNSDTWYEHQVIERLSLEIFRNQPKADYLNYNDDDIEWHDYEARELLEKIQKLIQKLKSLLKTDYDEGQYFNLAKTLQYEFLFLNLDYLNFKELRESLSYSDFENGNFEDEYDDFYDGNENKFDIIGQKLDKIKSYAEERHNLDAYAVLAGYYRYLANQIAPYGRDGSTFGAKWDNDKQKYIKSKETSELKKQYDEYMKLADHYQEFVKFAPAHVSEINFDSDKETIYKQFLYLCNRGDLQAIEDFLYSHIFKNSGEAWVYIYLAQLLGTDFTQDDYKAINAYTGEDYDDYGPIEVVGREAIQYAMHLDNLSEEKDQLAQKIAQELFEKI